jgi:ribosomal protein S18 acetylase RimI-like enzyme
MTISSALDRRIQDYLRRQAFQMGDHERVGCFVASFDAHSANPFLNYAVPDVGADPDETAITALAEAFARRARMPRLEYIEATAPLVAPRLVAAGFAIDACLPIMICGEPSCVRPPAEGTHVALASDDTDIVQAAETVAAAFGSDASHPDGLRRLVAQGGVLAIARDSDSEMIVGAGVARPICDGVTELAGIGVVPAFRRRGIAGAMTSLLAREAFERGAALAWLSPGGEEAERIYARAGFVPASEQLHISRKDGSFNPGAGARAAQAAARASVLGRLCR